jgi:hypothetical protein
MQSFEASLAALAADPHTLTTTYMKQAIAKIDALTKEAEAEEIKNNKAKVAELKKEVKVLE